MGDQKASSAVANIGFSTKPQVERTMESDGLITFMQFQPVAPMANDFHISEPSQQLPAG